MMIYSSTDSIQNRDAPVVTIFAIVLLPRGRTGCLEPESRDGGIGRRAGLKIRWGSPRVGSSPTLGTNSPGVS